MHIEKEFSLEHYNTFHLPCKADYFAEVKSASDFIDLTNTPERKQTKKKLFIGTGSNMLLVNDVFDGLVIHNSILGKDIVTNIPEGINNNEEVYIKVGGGENWSDFVRWTIDQGYYGIENLVSIPGSIAAAPIQNIGAYGTDISHAVVNVGGISSASGTYETIPHKRCQFGYRDSVFKNDLKGEFFITDVTIRLQRYNADSYAPIANYGTVSEELAKKGIVKPTPCQMAEVIAAIRASKLPDMKVVGTAGSFFKNIMMSRDEYADFLDKLKTLKPDLKPEVYELEGGFFKIPTGRILDQVLGYRGHREGHVGCREQQALCLVNYGGATGKEIVAFCEKLQEECEEKLGVKIEPEVNFIY